ncbi:hypothetical protein [Methylovulum psychrotolerans]|uniref:Uncharacterized protein n=1 Tax=Methylovulum psychrotolerans TaxID=1704499 RepID=A0A1Z4C4F8_9GAMM|nr:hypothetical protein [Methylovulum psychrotolerans]ASF48432.1 hypothetical protein CEK71_21545 [Methylovulum psychrotolerans]
MNLYNSYCYPDIQSVADSVQSRLVLDGFGLIQSVTPTSANDLAVVYLSSDSVAHSATLYVPDCARLGFDSSYTGLSVADSLDLAWAVVAVLAVAFGFKILKRSF